MADISQINLPDGSSFDIKDATARSNKADRTPLPPEYDPTVTYYAGDICTHDGNVYYTNYGSTTGTWNPDAWHLLSTPQQDYLHSTNPLGVGSFSLNRKVGTTVGNLSFASGQETTASGKASHAENLATTASGDFSHAEGGSTVASGAGSHAEGSSTSATGIYSHAEGFRTTANHAAQHVFGEYNVSDPSTATSNNRGNYIEIVGNGVDVNTRSNARTLDWDGNEVLAGGLKINGTQNVATQVSLTQAEYDALVQAGTVDLVNTVYFITDGNANANSASETTYDNTSSGLSATNVQGAIDEVDSGLSGKQDTLINQAITITPNTSILGSSGFSGACYQYGKIVTLFIQTMEPISEVAYETVFISGLPKTAIGLSSRCAVFDRKTGKSYRCTITDSGQLKEWYNSNGKIPANADLYSMITYISG